MGIYMIINKINNKIYIGQARNIKERWKNHINDLKNNKHYNKHLQGAWNKYGKDSFEFIILCECEEKEEMRPWKIMLPRLNTAKSVKAK